LHLTRHKRGSAVALVAAFALVLQAFLTAWTAAAMPAPPPTVDAFGHPLCLNSIGQDGTSPSGDHSKSTNCCAFGCGMAASLLVAPPGNTIGSLRPLAISDIRYRLRAADHDSDPDRHPGSPRAPPPFI